MMSTKHSYRSRNNFRIYKKGPIMSVMFAVGQQFPFPVPCGSGARACLTSSSLELIIQINKMTGAEKRAVQKGVKIRAWKAEDACGLFISIGEGKITLDATINAALQPNEAVEFIDRGGNNVPYYVLDRGKIQRLGIFGLHFVDLKLLKDCFRHQIDKNIGNAEWDRILSRVYRKYPRPELLPVNEIVPLPKDGIEGMRAYYSVQNTGKTYPDLLPSDLADWHVYLPDCGHSICALLCEPSFPIDWEKNAVPVPVKMVQRMGYISEGGVIWCPAAQKCLDRVLGLVCPVEDNEY
jgi:hypothetical protein